MTELIVRLFASVLTVSLGCSVVILLLRLFSLPFGRLRAAGRYLIWMLIILRLALPLTLPLLPMGISLALPQPSVTVDRPAAETGVAPGTMSPPETAAPVTGEPSVFSPGMDLPDVGDTVPTPLLPATGWTEADTDRVTVVLPEPAEPQTSAAPDLLEGAAWIWAVTAVVLFSVRFVRGLMLNANLAKLGRPLTDPALCGLYTKLCIQMGLRHEPEVRVCPALGSPLVYGFTSPVVLLPEEVDDPAAFAGVAAHELTHIRRRDLWLKLISLAAVSLHWFNPLVYLAVHRFGEETELSCDEAVLRDCDAEARRAYGYVLLSILRGPGKRARGLTTQFKPNKRSVRARFTSIVDLSPKRSGRVLIAVTLAVCLLMGTLVACRVTGDDDSDLSSDGVETPAGPSDVTTTPEETSELIPLTFTPVIPTTVEQTWLSSCYAGEVSINADVDGSWIEICQADTRAVIDAWTRISDAHMGMAFYRNAKGEQALLASPDWYDGNQPWIVDGVHGMGQMCEFRRLEMLDVSGVSAVLAEYISGSRSTIALYVRQGGGAARWLSASNSLTNADLDGDDTIEWIANAGLSVPTHSIYAVRGGQICEASLNEAIARLRPDAQFVSVTCSSEAPLFTAHLTYADRSETLSLAYRDGALVVDGHLPRVTSAVSTVIGKDVFRLPRVNGEGAQAINERIIADFRAWSAPYAHFSQQLIMQANGTVDYNAPAARLDYTYAVGEGGALTLTLRWTQDKYAVERIYQIAADNSWLSTEERIAADVTAVLPLVTPLADSVEQGAYRRFAMQFGEQTIEFAGLHVVSPSYSIRTFAQDLTQDGNPDAVVVLTAGYGTGVLEEEVHVFDGVTLVEYTVAPLLDAIRDAYSFSADAVHYTVLLDDGQTGRWRVPRSIASGEMPYVANCWTRYTIEGGSLVGYALCRVNMGESIGQFRVRFAEWKGKLTAVQHDFIPVARDELGERLTAIGVSETEPRAQFIRALLEGDSERVAALLGIEKAAAEAYYTPYAQGSAEGLDYYHLTLDTLGRLHFDFTLHDPDPRIHSYIVADGVGGVTFSPAVREAEFSSAATRELDYWFSTVDSYLIPAFGQATEADYAALTDYLMLRAEGPVSLDWLRTRAETCFGCRNFAPRQYAMLDENGLYVMAGHGGSYTAKTWLDERLEGDVTVVRAQLWADYAELAPSHVVEYRVRLIEGGCIFLGCEIVERGAFEPIGYSM